MNKRRETNLHFNLAPMLNSVVCIFDSVHCNFSLFSLVLDIWQNMHRDWTDKWFCVIAIFIYSLFSTVSNANSIFAKFSISFYFFFISNWKRMRCVRKCFGNDVACGWHEYLRTSIDVVLEPTLIAECFVVLVCQSSTIKSIFRYDFFSSYFPTIWPSVGHLKTSFSLFVPLSRSVKS